jgi:hypothetical protein
VAMPVSRFKSCQLDARSGLGVYWEFPCSIFGMCERPQEVRGISGVATGAKTDTSRGYVAQQIAQRLS